MKDNRRYTYRDQKKMIFLVLAAFCAFAVLAVWENVHRSSRTKAWHAVSGYYNMKQMPGIQSRNESRFHSMLWKVRRKKQELQGYETGTGDDSFYAAMAGGGMAAAPPSEEYGGSAGAWTEPLYVNGSYSRTNVRTAAVDEGDVVKTDGTYLYVLERDMNRIKIYRAKNGKTDEVSVIDLKKYGMALLDLEDGLYLTKDYLAIIGYQKFDDAESTYYENVSSMREAAGYQRKRIPADGYFPGEDREMIDRYAMSNLREYKKLHKGDGWLEGCWGCTQTLVFDIHDRRKPELIRGFFQEGAGYSRMSDGILYIFTERDMLGNETEPEWDRPQTYIPKIQGKCMDAEDIVVGRNMVGADYLVLSSISLKDLDYVDQLAVLGDGERLRDQYVSRDNLYLGWRYREEKLCPGGNPGNLNDYWKVFRTRLLRISYKKGKFQKEADGSIAGYINDHYCMDEKDGYLRLVCTYEEPEEDREERVKNALYILDEDLELTGEIADLAMDEVIHSARFMGDKAYFVTYKDTDPLFAADISDPEHPKLLSELELPGYSDYLHPFGDGLLLGIGAEPAERDEFDEDEEEDVVKLAMYDISDPEHVREISRCALKKTHYSQVFEDPKSLLADPKKGIIGLNLTGDPGEADMDWESYFHDPHWESYFFEIEEYGVFTYDREKGFQRKVLAVPPHSSVFSNELGNVRGVMIGDWLYVCWPLGKPQAYRLE